MRKKKRTLTDAEVDAKFEKDLQEIREAVQKITLSEEAKERIRANLQKEYDRLMAEDEEKERKCCRKKSKNVFGKKYGK